MGWAAIESALEGADGDVNAVALALLRWAGLGRFCAIAKEFAHTGNGGGRKVSAPEWTYNAAAT